MRFILIDRVLELEPGRRIVATRHVDPSDDYFPDHFPGSPIVPGVLLVEMVGQAAALCVVAGGTDDRWPVLLQIRQATFRKAAGPGADLRIEVAIEGVTAATATARGHVNHGPDRLADCTLTLGYLPRSPGTQSGRDDLLAAYLREPSETSDAPH